MEINTLLQEDQKHIWHPFTPLQGGWEPLLITEARGLYLHTEDGRKIMDLISSWYVNLHGHAHPKITQALAQQAEQMHHVMFAGFTHKPAIRLSKKLLSLLSHHYQKVFYSDNGSTAVEVALKMAIQYWANQGIKKRKVIAMQGAYHGDTFGSMSVGERGLFSQPYAPFLFNTAFIDFPHTADEKKVIDQFKKLLSGGEIAAFIVEPLVQATAGMRIYREEILNQLFALAKEHQVIIIADEVFTGFGRTGKMFACGNLPIAPDIICLSKGLTGGTLPLGATVCSNQIASQFDSPDIQKMLFHGHSYTANPLACAAALANLDLLEDQDCQDRIAWIQKSHQDFQQNLTSQKHPLKEVRTLGTLIAFELDIEQGNYNHQVRDLIYNFFLERDMLIRPLGHIFYLLPPYIIQPNEITKVYAAIEEFLSSLRKGKRT